MLSVNYGLFFICTLSIFASMTVYAIEDSFRTAYPEIRVISKMTEQLFDEYIQRYMDCEDIARCRKEMTSLRLTALPPFDLLKIDVSKEHFFRTWAPTLEKQLIGLQEYAKILSDASSTLMKLVGDSTGAKYLEKMYSLSIRMTRMIAQLQRNVSRQHCYPLTLPQEVDIMCEICREPHLPSRPLEIIRNYQFLLQMRDYITNMEKSITYLILNQPPNYC